MDRLGWAAGRTVAPLGTPIGIRVAREEDLAEVDAVLSRRRWKTLELETVSFLYSLKLGGERGRGRRDFSLLYLNAARLERTLDREELLSKFQESLEQFALYSASQTVALSGALVSVNSRLVLFPTLGGSGLTTLLAGLGQIASLEVLAEHYLCLHQDGSVQGFPIQGEAVGPEVVVLTEYSPKVKAFRPKRLSPGSTALNLFSFSVNASRDPELALKRLTNLAQNCLCYQGRRGDVKLAAPKLLDLLKKSRPSRV